MIFDRVRRFIEYVEGAQDKMIKMKIGFRIPSLKKRIAARTSVKRIIRHNLGFKAPRGWGWITNPKKAAYNRVYNRTTRGCILNLIVMLLGASLCLIPLLLLSSCSGGSDSNTRKGSYVKPSIDSRGRFRKGHYRRPVSTSKDVYKNRARSRTYYHTKGKYRRKLKWNKFLYSIKSD